jgi:murein hydrolase activator
MTGRRFVGTGRPPMTGGRRVRARLALLAVGLLAGTAAPAAAEERAPVDPLARVRLREMVLTERSIEADARARADALAAYRLLRRRRAAYLADPDGRGDDARAAGAAVRVFRRQALEAAALRTELARTTAERQGLEGSAGLPAVVAPALPASAGGAVALVPPVRGARTAAPGVRKDPATGAERRLVGLEILARLNEPVRAPAAGTLRRVTGLPQGGYAVVTVHEGGLVGILTGLRRVDVAPGAPVAAGQPLGVVGRNLDGAPVVAFELWRDGAPVDPRPLLYGTTTTTLAPAPAAARRRGAAPGAAAGPPAGLDRR